MTDFRSRAEKNEDANRQVLAQQDHKRALAEMNETVSGRLNDLEQKTQAIAGHSSETRQALETQVSSLTDDISKVHAMIRAGSENDMQLIEQMNRNHERRLNSMMKLIQDI